MRYRKLFITSIFVLLITGFVLFYLLPFVYIIYYSSTESTISHVFTGFDNYLTLMKSEYFIGALINTMLFSLVSVVLTMLLAYAAAMLLQTKSLINEILLFVIVLPFFLPVSGISGIFYDLFSYDSAIVQILRKYLYMNDYISRNLLLYVYFIWKNTGICCLFYHSAMSSISDEYHDAAKLFGCCGFDKLKYVYIPFTVPSILFSFVWLIMCSFNLYSELYIWYGAYPDKANYMLQHYLNNKFTKMDYSELSAATLVFMAVCYFVIVIFFRIDNKYNKRNF